MKKVIYSAIIVVFCFNVNAQSSFTLQNPDNYLAGPSGQYFFEGSVDVYNSSASAKTVLMFRKINNVAPGHESYFCWGQNCYSPFTDTAQYQEIIQPGDLLHARADLTSGYVSGLSKVTYCWYDVSNPADSICLEFVYDITTGIDDPGNSSSAFISLPYPNPSNEQSTIFYNLKKQGADSRIIFYNVLGSKVLDVKLSDQKNEVEIKTASMPEGIYHYALIQDGKMIGINKLIVTHTR